MRPPRLVLFSPKELLKFYYLTAIQACLTEGGLSVAVQSASSFEACICSTLSGPVFGACCSLIGLKIQSLSFCCCLSEGQNTRLMSDTERFLCPQEAAIDTGYRQVVGSIMQHDELLYLG